MAPVPSGGQPSWGRRACFRRSPLVGGTFLPLGTLLRIIVTALLAVALLFLVTLALPVEAWRRGEPAGPRLEATAASPEWPRPLRLWVDSDAACGHSPRTDPDDCFALLLLAQSPEIELVGISTVFGNAALDVTDSTTRGLVDQLPANGRGRPIVVRGAARPVKEPAGGGRAAGETAAHMALERALEKGPLVVLALGPLTNLATLLGDRPDLRSKVLGVVVVMGRRRGHLFHPVEGATAPSILGHGPVFRDFNFAKDPEAALDLLGMGLPLTLVPYEAAREVTLTGGDLDRMAAAGRAARWVADRARGWLSYWEDDIGRRGFYPFDLVAAGWVVRPDVARCATVVAWMGKDAGIFGWLGRRGMFVQPPAERSTGAGTAAPARYCLNLARHAGDWFLARLTSPGSEGDFCDGGVRR